MDLQLQPNWQRTLGQRVEIWKCGEFVREATVEAVMPDNSLLWASAEGNYSRQIYSRQDGYQVFTHFLPPRRIPVGNPISTYELGRALQPGSASDHGGARRP